MYKIAQSYGTTVQTLQEYNNLSNTSLSIGQQILIPKKDIAQEPPITEEEIIYIVKNGDSLWNIANRYNITVDQLKKANNLNSNLLTIGQQLIIPITSSSNTPSTYTVKNGDSLWKIALQYNTTVAELKRKNNLTSDNLSIGQVLII